MKSRYKAFGRSMPKKSKHGSKIARWGNHKEMKEKVMRVKNSKARYYRGEDV